MDRRELGAGTRVVRAARSLPPGDGLPVVPPLVQSVAFDYGSAAEQDAVFGNERPGYVYGRYGTPTTAALDERPTALLYVEAIANPLLRVNDVAALAVIAQKHGAALAVDATFATPILFRPAQLGATMVVHSLTKYINGHGDVMGGVVGGSADLAREMRDRTILDGAYLPPHEAWLAIRGKPTPALRVRRQCASALEIAKRLAKHPKIARVRYPGLPDHPQHELATRQFGGLYGGVVSFALREDTREAAFRFLDALELAASASTVGDLYIEVLYPPISSHRRLPPEERTRLGITDGFLRLSVGIEDPDDILADLERALERV